MMASTVQAIVCIGIASVLKVGLGLQAPSDRLVLPTAFQFATALLAIGSWALHVSLGYVQRERQRQFRTALLIAVAAAILFIGIQSYGLLSFMQSTHDTHKTQTNVHGFVFLFATLHAMHFVVAQSVLLWVTISAFADRYDHEYYWGVTFAAWLWHGLGIVWLAILCIFGIISG
jgi:heme/copper-type cytochrome/quinol oxidase subunit 3